MQFDIFYEMFNSYYFTMKDNVLFFRGNTETYFAFFLHGAVDEDYQMD